MKLIDAITKINKKNRKEIYSSNKKYCYVVLWEQDKYWIEINQLMKDSKL